MTIKISKEPLSAKCFKCSKKFNIKWVISRRDYSQKNNLEYWTGKVEDRNKLVCNECLRDFYTEKWGDYKSLDSKKKNLFRVYLAIGKFD